MAMSLPVSPLTPVSDIQSAASSPVNNTSNNNNGGSRQEQLQMPPLPPTAPTTTTTSTQMKRKPSRRANTAERRATHNAVERQRRETLNGRFLDLAALLPNLSQIRRPSKSSIVNSSIAYIHASRRHHLLASRELRLLRSESDHLRLEINEWRDRAGLMRMEEPVRSEGFGVVISGQMEVVQATLKPGGGFGRGRRARGEGEEGDEDEDDGEEGEGEEDGMIGLGGYGGSYMDDVDEEIILESGVAPPTLQPVVEEFIPPPPSIHLHQQQQQQQMALNAAIQHSHQDMDDTRIANLLLKNGNNGFPPTSNFGFQQQQQQEQLPYNYQQPTFSSSYLPDKLWNDHQQYPPPHHQMIQQQHEQASRSLFNPPPPESLQQYHQPTLSVNTGVGMVEINNNDVIGMRGLIKTKIANAKANARVIKASSNGHPHSHSRSHSGSSPSHSSNSNSPISAGLISGNGRSPIQIPSPPDHHTNRSGSRSGSESGSTSCSSPSYELHSQDYSTGGVGGLPRRGSGMDHVVGFMNGMGGLAAAAAAASGMNRMNMGMTGIPGMGYGGPGHANNNEMMMMMM